MPQASQSERARLADVNAPGRHYMSQAINELTLLRHAAATHLRYQESVEDCLRRGDAETALGILGQQRANLTRAVERTGALLGGRYADLYTVHLPRDTDAVLAAAREQAQP